jgi:hypothetical protein
MSCIRLAGDREILGDDIYVLNGIIRPLITRVTRSPSRGPVHGLAGLRFSEFAFLIQGVR